MNEIKIVTIKSAIDIWDSPEVQEMFCALVKMKRDGYIKGFNQEHHVLPLDGTDFIATHHIICKRDKAKLIPLLAYKSCNKEDCDKYNISFSALSSVLSSNSQIHIQAIREFIKESEDKKYKIAYDSSFTVNPILNDDPELGLKVFSIFMGISVHYKNEENLAKTLMLANLQFKTDKMFKKMGSTPLHFQGCELDSIVCPYLGFSEMKIFTCNRTFSKKALSLADKYQGLWFSRINLKKEDTTEDIKTA